MIRRGTYGPETVYHDIVYPEAGEVKTKEPETVYHDVVYPKEPKTVYHDVVYPKSQEPETVYHDVVYPKEQEEPETVYHKVEYPEEQKEPEPVYHDVVYPKEPREPEPVYHKVEYPKEPETVYHDIKYPEQKEPETVYHDVVYPKPEEPKPVYHDVVYPGEAANTVNNIDFTPIKSYEQTRTTGYLVKLPNKKTGKLEIGPTDGLTIGTGINLGAQSEESLRNMGVSDTIINKVKPALGKRGPKNQAYLDGLSISLDKDEVQELDEAVMTYNTDELKTKFNKDFNTDFDDLPKRWRSALADVLWNYGPSLYDYDLWRDVGRGYYDDALANLWSFGSIDERQDERRKVVALWIQDDLDWNRAALEDAVDNMTYGDIRNRVLPLKGLK